ncbi:hypothetical protein K9L16_01060 [Candidatus Pacearchaeota archaeon]|nr:hypothetical protein [Candidatus Pacearchaeota archaeon]
MHRVNVYVCEDVKGNLGYSYGSGDPGMSFEDLETEIRNNPFYPEINFCTRLAPIAFSRFQFEKGRIEEIMKPRRQIREERDKFFNNK